MRSPRRMRDRLAAEVHEQHLHLAAIVGVDRAGRVQQRQPVAHARARSAAAPGLRSPREARSAMPVGHEARARRGASVDVVLRRRPARSMPAASGRHVPRQRQRLGRRRARGRPRTRTAGVTRRSTSSPSRSPFRSPSTVSAERARRGRARCATRTTSSLRHRVDARQRPPRAARRARSRSRSCAMRLMRLSLVSRPSSMLPFIWFFARASSAGVEPVARDAAMLGADDVHHLARPTRRSCRRRRRRSRRRRTRRGTSRRCRPCPRRSRTSWKSRELMPPPSAC